MGYRTKDVREQIRKILWELYWAVGLFILGMLFALLIFSESARINNVPVSTYIWQILWFGCMFSGPFMFIRYMDDVRKSTDGQVGFQKKRRGWRRGGFLHFGYLVIFLSPVLIVPLLIRRFCHLHGLLQDKEDIK